MAPSVPRAPRPQGRWPAPGAMRATASQGSLSLSLFFRGRLLSFSVFFRNLPPLTPSFHARRQAGYKMSGAVPFLPMSPALEGIPGSELGSFGALGPLGTCCFVLVAGCLWLKPWTQVSPVEEIFFNSGLGCDNPSSSGARA